jgi:4-hydroxy-2-oxoheptanedioate aldolase
LGRRPLDGGNSDGAYCQIPGEEYLRQANQERFVIIQIEDPEPMEELEEIAAVEGIDVLFFGPADYAQGLGIPYQFDHPAVTDALQKIAAAAARHGKYAGTPATDDNLAELADMGYNFLCLGADVLMLSEGFTAVAESFRRLAAGRASAKRCDACKGDGAP